MGDVLVEKADGIAVVCLARGKVNALVGPMVEEIHERFVDLEADPDVKAVILTGRGKFFSFGFDIPEFLSWPKEAFVGYLAKFAKLYTYLFQFPKPTVAALNGHAVAGGCMLAGTCDFRLMVSGKARIALNEINFGSSVFYGSAAMLAYWVGHRNARDILFSGSMYSAEQAAEMGLVDRIVSEESLMPEAQAVARNFAGKDSAAFRGVKKLLRQSVVEDMVARDEASIREFVEIWYSENTWKNLQEIKVHS